MSPTHSRALLAFLAVLLLAAFPLPAQPVLFPHPLSPRIANYTIDVGLEPASRMLRGHEVLRWINKSPDVIAEMQFHLYMNGFRNSRSTFMKESGTWSRSPAEESRWGFIDVEKITLISSGEDLTGRMEYIRPDDGNPDDKTVFRLPLPKTLQPGDSVTLGIDFVEKLPQPPFARTGGKEEYFFVGQWFPKAGVYIDGKWNCHQFHANTEFFADFGVYDVRMTVPEKNLVGATGLVVEVKKNGNGTATHYYHAEDVHDFAWTTSPEFVEFKGRAQGVDIRVLMQPDHAGQGPRHVAAAQTAIEYFHAWYGNYPFPNFTIVDPRRGASATGGMEYPTLVTSETSYGVPEGIRLVELVIIHEFGHNYWYHLLASNEFEESWLDEGITSYSECQVMNDRYGPAGDEIDFLGIRVNDIQQQRLGYLNNATVDPTIRNGWQYYSGTSYGVNSYGKPALLLTTLHNYLGKEVMLKVMRTYVERWSFRHPHTKDFIAVANEASGQDLNWFFDQALYSNAVLDYSVDKVRSDRVPERRGYDFSLRTSGARDSSSSSGKGNTTPAGAEKDSSAKRYLSEINVRRLGTFVFPVDVEMRFENGETVRERWDGREPWKKYTYTKTSRLVSATVDPDHKVLLDVNFTNNSKTLEPQALGINTIAARFLFWVQFFLDEPDVLALTTFLSGLL